MMYCSPSQHTRGPTIACKGLLVDCLAMLSRSFPMNQSPNPCSALAAMVLAVSRMANVSIGLCGAIWPLARRFFRLHKTSVVAVCRGNVSCPPAQMRICELVVLVKQDLAVLDV